VWRRKNPGAFFLQFSEAVDECGGQAEIVLAIGGAG
jgi:hypothetical protein